MVVSSGPSPHGSACGSPTGGGQQAMGASQVGGWKEMAEGIFQGEEEPRVHRSLHGGGQGACAQPFLFRSSNGCCCHCCFCLAHWLSAPPLSPCIGHPCTAAIELQGLQAAFMRSSSAAGRGRRAWDALAQVAGAGWGCTCQAKRFVLDEGGQANTANHQSMAEARNHVASDSCHGPGATGLSPTRSRVKAPSPSQLSGHNFSPIFPLPPPCPQAMVSGPSLLPLQLQLPPRLVASATSQLRGAVAAGRGLLDLIQDARTIGNGHSNRVAVQLCRCRWGGGSHA